MLAGISRNTIMTPQCCRCLRSRLRAADFIGTRGNACKYADSYLATRVPTLNATSRVVVARESTDNEPERMCADNMARDGTVLGPVCGSLPY